MKLPATPPPLQRLRLLRFCAWALTMAFTDYLILQAGANSRWAALIPCIFMAFFVPAVLLPLPARRS